MKFIIALVIAAMHTQLAACAPRAIIENEAPDRIENSHRPRDITITVAQTLFEDPSIKSCADKDYGCSRHWCWKKVRLPALRILVGCAATNNAHSAVLKKTGAGLSTRAITMSNAILTLIAKDTLRATRKVAVVVVVELKRRDAQLLCFNG